MRSDAYDTDSYLTAWWQGNPKPCGDNLEAEADDAGARLEAAYDDARLRVLKRAPWMPPAAGPCIESIQRIKENLGVTGVRVMAYRQGELVSEIITEARVFEVWSKFLEPCFYPKDREVS